MVTSRQKKAMRENGLKEVKAYIQVLKDMGRYAESQKKKEAGDIEKRERLGYCGLSGKSEYGE